MKKKIIIVVSFFIVFLVYMGSKYVYYYVQEDAYYSSSFTGYDSEKDYVMLYPVNRKLNRDCMFTHIDTSLLHIKFKLPFNSAKDSIHLISKDNALVGGTIEGNKQNKGILFHLTSKSDMVIENLKDEVAKINKGIRIENNYELYNKIYSHVPKMNLLLDNYDDIKYNLRLTKLKAITLPNGGDKNIFRIYNANYKGFQFCSPDNSCKTVTITIFKEEEEWIFVFKSFTQDEIDFVLSSMEWKDHTR